MHTYKWLAIETSTDMLSLAIAWTQGDKSQVWAHTSQGGAKSSQLVLPEIVRLMEEAQMRFADLTAVVFGKGPGSFTGLRTACSVAQGLAFGAGVLVLPIDTLLAVAEDARYQSVQQKQQQTQQQLKKKKRVKSRASSQEIVQADMQHRLVDVLIDLTHLSSNLHGKWGGCLVKKHNCVFVFCLYHYVWMVIRALQACMPYCVLQFYVHRT
jgi:tRNA threonylcarbamoyl adenosine modification protein YeaZ